MAQRKYDVAILGAGAAGLMAAARLRETADLAVCVIEGNDGPGAKIRISGGGKCNLTNVRVTPGNYLGDAKLVEEVLAGFDAAALLSWVRDRGCRPVLRKERYWFCPRSAQELIDILLDAARGSHFFYGRKIEAVERDGAGFTVVTSKERFHAAKVIVATGGPSFATVGATDIGIRIAGSLGIETVPFRPALAGLTLQKEQFWMKALSGISLPVTIRVGGRRIREDMLFAHRGISGPAVLSASLYWEKGTIAVDFLDGRKLPALLERGGKKKLSTALPLPRRFVRGMLEHLRIPDRPCDAYDTLQRQELEAFVDYRFAPAGTFGFARAEVSKGGVAAAELHSPSCESRKVPGLFFVGETVDVTGELGGYNFQWAFASACAAYDKLLEKC